MHRARGRRRTAAPLVALVLAACAPAVTVPRPDVLPACAGFGLTYPRPLAPLVELEARVGCRFEGVRWYQDWGTPFDLGHARAIAARGAEPRLSWQPMTRTRDGRASGVPYREIASGAYDAYVRAFARDVRRLGRPIAVAFAPEMNGEWVPYRLTAANRAEDFVAAFRRLRRLFLEEGASARWVWTPNVLHPTQTATFAELYPGDADVDALGLDGYNWGTTREQTRWQSFEEVFGPSLAALSALSDKPVEVAELASAEAGGDKAGWIRDMCRSLGRYPRVVRLDWFNVDNTGTERVNWRLDSSAAALGAFAACARDRARPVRDSGQATWRRSPPL